MELLDLNKWNQESRQAPAPALAPTPVLAPPKSEAHTQDMAIEETEETAEMKTNATTTAVPEKEEI